MKYDQCARSEIIARAKRRIERAKVVYGNTIAYTDDANLMLDLIGLVESLQLAEQFSIENSREYLKALEPFAKAARVIIQRPQEYEDRIVMVGGLSDAADLYKRHFFALLVALQAPEPPEDQSDDRLGERGET